MPRRRKKRLSSLTTGVLPPTQSDFTSADIAKLAGVDTKTLVLWRRSRIIPRVPLAGPKTRYGRDIARRACAIAKVGSRAAQHPRFEEMIPIILDEAPRAARAGAPRPEAPPPVEAIVPLPPPPPVKPSDEPDVPFQAVAWQRLELLPGIEIHLADSVPPIMRGVVREIAKRFGRTL